MYIKTNDKMYSHLIGTEVSIISCPGEIANCEIVGNPKMTITSKHYLPGDPKPKYRIVIGKNKLAGKKISLRTDLLSDKPIGKKQKTLSDRDILSAVFNNVRTAKGIEKNVYIKITNGSKLLVKALFFFSDQGYDMFLNRRNGLNTISLRTTGAKLCHGKTVKETVDQYKKTKARFSDSFYEIIRNEISDSQNINDTNEIIV